MCGVGMGCCDGVLWGLMREVGGGMGGVGMGWEGTGCGLCHSTLQFRGLYNTLSCLLLPFHPPTSHLPDCQLQWRDMCCQRIQSECGGVHQLSHGTIWFPVSVFRFRSVCVKQLLQWTWSVLLCRQQWTHSRTMCLLFRLQLRFRLLPDTQIQLLF